MQLIGKHAKTGERVDITQFDEPRKVFKFGDILCPLCDSVMFPKAGMIRAKHFAHASQCPSPLAMPESLDHLLGKSYIADQLRRELEQHAANGKVELEVPIPAAGRVADVLVTFAADDDWRVAHECQLAAITQGELAERTESYTRAKVDVIWWLGKKAATKENLTWCVNTLGVAYEIEFFTQKAGGEIDRYRAEDYSSEN